MDFEELIRFKTSILITQIQILKDGQDIINLHAAFAAYVGDIITSYCFAFDRDHLHSDHFRDNFHNAFAALARISPVAAHFPLVPKLLEALPGRLVVALQPSFEKFAEFRGQIQNDIRQVAGEVKENKPGHDRSYRTIFKSLLEDLLLQHSEKTPERLLHEAISLLAAGQLTTSRLLTVGAFYIIRDPNVYQKLREELRQSIPDPSLKDAFDWGELERLPYLTGCVKEALRLSYPVTGRSAREFPTPIKYGEQVIPPGTVISITLADIHQDEDLFTEHRCFKPERWIPTSEDKNGEKANDCFIPFGAGRRACLGINLAMCEIYYAIAAVFLNFEFELYETDYSDIEVSHDYFTPYPRAESQGVRVKCV